MGEWTDVDWEDVALVDELFGHWGLPSMPFVPARIGCDPTYRVVDQRGVDVTDCFSGANVAPHRLQKLVDATAIISGASRC